MIATVAAAASAAVVASKSNFFRSFGREREREREGQRQLQKENFRQETAESWFKANKRTKFIWTLSFSFSINLLACYNNKIT